MYLAWGRVRTDGAHAYVRRVLLNEFLGRRRRGREHPVDAVPDRPAPAGGSLDDRLDLSAALRAIPARLGPRPHIKAGPVEWLRMCEMDVGYTVFPPHTQNHAEFALPVLRRPGDAATPATDNLTAATDRFEQLPRQYRTPARTT